jgi:signal peptidase complex subunit 1
MDFIGQKHAEQLVLYIVVFFAFISFLAGFSQGDFMLMVYINFAGLPVALLAVLPDWPWLNKNPVKWLPPLEAPTKEKKT